MGEAGIYHGTILSPTSVLLQDIRIELLIAAWSKYQKYTNDVVHKNAQEVILYLIKDYQIKYRHAQEHAAYELAYTRACAQLTHIKHTHTKKRTQRHSHIDLAALS